MSKENPTNQEEQELQEQTFMQEDTTQSEDQITQETETDELTKLQEKIKEQEDKYLRLYAEFDNFRRRSAKEKLDLMQTAGATMLQSLLPVLDDFTRSLKASETNQDGLKEGVELVYKKFNGLLENQGLVKMVVIGKEFDADLHEAITQIPVQEKKMKGKIVDVVEDGYLLNERVIRFAKVIIGI
jgi:molecular chaperone GrpE